MCNPYCRLPLLILCLQAFFAVNLLGQTSAEVNAGIQLNFSTPGARSLGMGGAFIGLADDATAAYANPAGLTTLSRPEVSLEARHWSFSNIFTNRGRFSGTPTGQGIDTLADLQDDRSKNDQDGLSFFSYVYPQPRWAVALYRHELANLGASFKTEGAFVESQANSTDRLRPTHNTLDLHVVNFGLTASFRISDTLSLGGGISLYDFNLTSETDRFKVVPLLLYSHANLFDSPDNILDKQIQRGADHKLAVNAGFLWTLNNHWKLGGVYRQGPRLEFDAMNKPGPKAPARIDNNTHTATFDIPDVFGLGASFQPTDFKTILLDVTHVRYSDLTQKFIKITTESIESCSANHCGFMVHDANEVHVGFENTFPFWGALFSARAGTWYDPDHRIGYKGDEAAFKALFRSGKNEIHYSTGLGYTSRSGRYQVDAAVDFSDRVNTASLSAVVRF